MIPKQTYYSFPDNPSGSDHHTSLTTTMRKKFIVSFLIALLILIASEYFFLEEMFGRSNIAILLLTGFGIAISILSIVSLIRKYN